VCGVCVYMSVCVLCVYLCVCVCVCVCVVCGVNLIAVGFNFFKNL